MTSQQIKKVLPAIRTMEKSCLSSDSKPTTAADIRTNGLAQTRDYYNWLRRQAPRTSMWYADFDDLLASAKGRRR